MDIETLRERWQDPEFRKAFFGGEPEPSSAIMERVKRRVARARQWRNIRRMIPRAALAVILALAGYQLFVSHSEEQPLQTAAFILGVLTVSALNKVNKLRDKYAQPKLWLNHREFLIEEQVRIGQNMRLDRYVSVLMSAGIAALGLYGSSYLAPGARIVCWIATGAVLLLLQLYDYRKMAALRESRTALKEQLEDLLGD